MGIISNFYGIICLLLYAEVTCAIYDPSVTTTKPPKRREPLPWYLAGDDAQIPVDFLVPPESPRNLGTPTKSWGNWRKLPGSEIEQRTEIHKGIDGDEDDKFGQEQYQMDQYALVFGVPSTGTLGDGGQEYLYSGGIKSKDKMPSEQRLYEGVTDDYNKPRKETIAQLNYQSGSKVAKYDALAGVQCPYPDATGQFIYPIDCKFFVNCWKGRAFVQPCAPGTHFNPETLECDYPNKVKCYSGELEDFVPVDYTNNDGNREPLLNKYSGAHRAPSPAPAKPNHYTPQHSFTNYGGENNRNSWNPVLARQVVQTVVCPVEFSGLLPHPTDCRKFLQCDRGTAFIMDCGPGTAFNPAISVCDWPYNVPGCGNQPSPTYNTFYDSTSWPSPDQGNNRQGHSNWHGNSHVPHGQYQNYQHHHRNQPELCKYPGCPTGRQPPTGQFQPSPSHSDRHDWQHHKPWSNPDLYQQVNEPTDFTTPPTYKHDRWGEAPYGANYPNSQKYPKYPSGNRESYGRTKPDFLHPGGIVHDENTYSPEATIRQPGKEKNPKWIPNSGPYGDYHHSEADESTQHASHIFRPSSRSDSNYRGHGHTQIPSNPNGENTQTLDNKPPWPLTPNHFARGDKDSEYDDSKLDAWSSKSNIFHQGKGQVGQGTKNGPSGIHVNVDGIKGHYITKEIEIHQNHSKTRHYTPSISMETSTSFSINNYPNFNNRGSFKQDLNYSRSDSYPLSNFNSNKPQSKNIKYYNNTEDGLRNHYNKSHVTWKLQNNTTPTTHRSRHPIYNHDTDIAPDYKNTHDSSTIVPARPRKRSKPKGGITLWEKPDTNVPSVSIDEGEYGGNNSDEDIVQPDEDISSINNEHKINKFDIDVLDESKTWKPQPVGENKNKNINKNDRDDSVIMTINKKIKDVDLFNAESASWQEEELPFSVYYIPPVYSLGHSENSKPITPASGQFVRLRGGSSLRNGYVEVQGIQPGWGVVCDMENSWTIKKADIVCRQLGYTRGAETAWQGRAITKHIPSWIAATSVHCLGNETKFQSCKFDYGFDCDVERNAIGVSCLSNPLAHCRQDEIPHGGNCYHLADSNSGLNHAEALNYCIAKNSRLVDITSQMENNFLSDWLIMNHSHVDSIMTSGIGFTTFNRNIWLWEDSANAKFKYAKWWPGWKEEIKIPPLAGSRPVCIIMKKKFPCYDRSDKTCVADYFFWDVEDCATSMKGHSYVCKRPYDDISCIYGKGHQYAGNANVSASGKPCLPWNDESVAYPLLLNVVDREVRGKLKTHNFCRNPNPMKELRPWCFTGFYGEQEQCDIPPCGNIGTVRSPTGGQCKKGHFECMPEECIPSHWVCDGEEDCTNARDENSCFQHLDFFKRTPRHRLDGHDVEKWLNTPAMTCALRCKEAAFTCRSFSHKLDGNLCLLSDNNVGSSGALQPTDDYDYYEMTALSTDCDEMFTCNNKKCINMTQVCDGKNNCGDRSDENICTVEKLDYAIRLSGSENKFEGRVEVKFLGHWGQVCDDGFGMINAEVICHELGFPLGALSVRPGGFFGNLDPPTRFMVDQLKCRGNETSLKDCEFDGWGVHDCSPDEAVGVVCKTAVNTCPDDQWKCDNTPMCIPPFYICDEVTDCPDGSDEKPIHCDVPFEIRLVNGSSPREGRVEIRHHGVWGTVCDDDFSNSAAKVVCNSLGYKGSAVAKKNGFYGAGDGVIWLDEVFCFGNETQLYRCEHNNWGHNNCKHDEDVGVICQESSNDTDENEYEMESRMRSIDEDILPSDCGKRIEDFNIGDHRFERIVASSVAPKDSYPWQASIRIRRHSTSSHSCGAVIISPLHVLTAAHCLKGYNKGTYFIRAGDYNTEIPEGTEAEANIEDYYIHEDFRKGARMNNDIALVLLKGRGIPLGKHIMPICLPPSNSEYSVGLNCTISGFGSIQSGQSRNSQDLRFGWVPLIDQSVCRADYIYGPGAITDGMFCAGYLNEGVDACDGDSGGPLACLHNGAYTLYGITSWGQHCGKANKPGVYVRVAHYRDWIDKKIVESLSGR